MATKVIYLSGTCKWARLKKPDEKYNNFSISFYPDAASIGMIKESGLQLQPKEDEDGTFYKFRREQEKLIKREVVVFGPPAVLNSDGTEYDGLVGNGSSVTLKVSVYDTIKGKGHRLEIVRVDKLVEYNPPEREDADAGMPPPMKQAPAAAAGKRPF